MTSRARILALLGLSAACIWSLLSEERTAGVERVTDANTSRERRKAEATQALHRQRLVERQDENGRIAPDAMHRALAARRENLAAQARQPSFTAGGIEAGSWRWAGPDNIGGRCRSLYVHRTNPDRLVLGAVGGGIWLSDDAGVTWRPCDDLLGSLVISSLTADAGDPDIVYAGTGEAFGSASWVSIGVLRSRDGGLTWSQLGTANNPNFTTVNSLSAHPMRPGHLLVASYTGVWRSTDYGESWTRTLAGTSWRVTHHSTQGDSCVATQYGKIFWSRTGGRTWTEASVAPAATGSRVEVAWAKDRWTLYASAGYRDNDAYVYKSTDGGQTFRNVHRGNLFGKQGNYDNAIWVDPLDSNRVMVGGIGLYRSLDGGRTFRDINHGKMHVDFHAVVPDADYGVGGNRKVYVLNDAGVHWTEDIWKASVPGDWHNAYKGLGITQFFGGDVTRTGIVYGGTQDRGSTRRRTTLGFEHNALYGADGGECVADPDVSGLLYGEGQYAGVFRSRDDGRTFGVQITRQDAPDGMKDAGDSSTAPFIAPLVMDPDRPQRLWVGATSLWRTDDARVDKPTWRAARGPSPEGFVTAIGVTPGRSRTVFVGYGNGNLFRSDNATSLSPTWRRVDAAPLPNRAILKILVSPRDPDRVYVSLGGYQNDNLYSSSDGGQTWSSISGMGSLRLPPSPIRGLVVHPDMPRWIYVGTEVGVYVSTDHGDSWTTDNQGPANVAVEELVLKGGTLWAFTHGRGIFHANAAPVRSGFEDVVRASVDVVGTEGNRKSVTATLSQNGRHVAFESDASNLVPGDSGGVRDIFVRDRQAKTIRRVSESARRRGGNQVSRVACMARSGRYVAFESLATNLIPNDSNLMVDVFVKDLQTDAIERVSAIGADDDPDLEANGNSQTPSITPGGRIVVFSSYATNLVAGDRNKKRDVFLRDRAKRTVERISVSSSQGEGSGTSWNTRRAVSGDGRFVVFTSDSPDLVVGDRNGVADVFLRDRIDGSTKRISMTAGGNEADGVSQYACISDNGGFVVFESFARLDPGDSNNLSDVYLYDRATDKVRLISTPDGEARRTGPREARPFPSRPVHRVPQCGYGFGRRRHQRESRLVRGQAAEPPRATGPDQPRATTR